MDNDIDIRFWKNAQIYLSSKGRGRAKENILQLCGNHGSPPSISQGCPGSVEHDVSVILIDPHGCTVEHFHNLSIDSAGYNVQLTPQRLPLFRRPLCKRNFTILLRKILQRFYSNIIGYFFFLSALNRYAHDICHFIEFIDIFYRIAWIRIFRRQ